MNDENKSKRMRSSGISIVVLSEQLGKDVADSGTIDSAEILSIVSQQMAQKMRADGHDEERIASMIKGLQSMPKESREKMAAHTLSDAQFQAEVANAQAAGDDERLRNAIETYSTTMFGAKADAVSLLMQQALLVQYGLEDQQSLYAVADQLIAAATTARARFDMEMQATNHAVAAKDKEQAALYQAQAETTFEGLDSADFTPVYPPEMLAKLPREAPPPDGQSHYETMRHFLNALRQQIEQL